MTDILQWLDQYPLLFALFIVVARVTDVSMGTVRTIAVVRGHRMIAAVLGFFEVMVWLTVVSGVISHFTWWKMLSYGLGFALGNACGIMMESYMAMGQQLVIVISRHCTHSVAFALRLADFMVTEVPAKGAQGEVAMCFTLVPRRQVPHVSRIAQQVDEDGLVIVEDVRHSVLRTVSNGIQPTGWRSKLKKK